MTAQSAPATGADSILPGPGTYVPVPYRDLQNSGEEPGVNIAGAILHATRRRFLAMFVLGAVAGVAAGAAAWLGLKQEFTANARLWIPARDPSALADGGNSPGDFDLRKRNQANMITDPSILESVLLRDVKTLPIVRAQEDPRAWLKSCVSVTFPSDAELMELRVRCADRTAAIELAKTIRTVYLEEVVWTDFRTDQERLNELRNTLEGLKADFRREQGSLSQLLVQADAAGASQQLTPDQKLLEEKRHQYIADLRAIQAKVWDTELQLRLRDRPAVEAPEAVVDEESLQMYAEHDPQIATLRKQITGLERQKELAPEKYSGQLYEDRIAQLTKQISTAEASINERTVQLRREVELKMRQAVAGPQDTATLQRMLEIQQARAQELTDELAKLPPPQISSAPPAPTTSIEVQRLEVESIRSKIAMVREQLNQAELAKSDDQERQKAEGIRPAGDVFMLDSVDKKRRYVQAGAAGGAAFVVVVALIVMLDLRRRRLNHAGEVGDHLQLLLLGTIPLLRGRGPKRLENSARLSEAVDGVAATLLCQQDQRVVMISSAMAGEGKSTLAANLATSLASAGRRTLLIDFDLRRPILHQVYQLPIGPGMGELLSAPDTSGYADHLQETATENLWLVTAGARRQRALMELSDTRVSELFESFKEHFEFIIVDSPPALPVVDTRLIARHVDGVVISMLRDVSEIYKVKSACQLLQSYGARILGGVVIGATGDVYYGYPPTRVSSTA